MKRETLSNGAGSEMLTHERSVDDEATHEGVDAEVGSTHVSVVESESVHPGVDALVASVHVTSDAPKRSPSPRGRPRGSRDIGLRRRVL